jgi:hypothetical protein
MGKYLLCPEGHVWPQVEGCVSWAADDARCPVCRAHRVALPGEQPRKHGRKLCAALGVVAVAAAVAFLAPSPEVRAIAILAGVIVAAITLLVVLCFLPIGFRRYRRSQAQGMTHLAEALGLSYFADVPASLRKTCECIEKTISGSEFGHLMQGEWGGDGVIIGILSHHAGSLNTPGPRTYGHLSGEPIAVLPDVLRTRPTFRLRRGLNFPVRQLVNWLPSRDANFPQTVEHNGFRRLYWLQTTDVASARQLFDDRAVKFFADHPGWFILSDQGTLIVWRDLSAWEQFRRQFGRGSNGPDEWLPQSVLELLHGVGQIVPVLQHREDP